MVHRTYDKQHKCCSGRGVLFTDKDDTWGNGKASNAQSAAVDAAYGAAQTWDFYKDRFGRLGIKNNGKAAYSRVHFRKSYDNAFWDDGCFCMTYGDGGADFRPLVELDVAGHEMTHGVTAATANLDYVGDSGGLNESTSDVMGTMVEFSAHNAKDKGDYLLGEKIVKHGSFLRRMDNPKADGESKNCWSPCGRQSRPALLVRGRQPPVLPAGRGHRQQGRSAGGQHSSTACDGATLSGIGRTKAAAIWYRALTTKWTSTTTYPQAADGQVLAAKDCTAPDRHRASPSSQAWKGVGVNTVENCTSYGSSSSGNIVAEPGLRVGSVVVDDHQHPAAPTSS